MKTKRLFSFFLSLVLFLTVLPFAAAAKTEEVPPQLPEDPNILAKAAVLLDVDTDTVIYAKNEHESLPPASLTKVMTALLVLEALEDGTLTKDQMITASESAFEGIPADASSAGIKPGEIMSVENLLKCVLIVSANEACNILAETISGSVSAFVEKMNARAEELGCKDTHFANCNGLHDPQHYTSAWDLYLITKAALQYEDFVSISDTANAVIPATNINDERSLWTTNHLISSWRVIGYRNKDAHGIKTGHTDEAGYCLISSAKRNKLHLVSVILGAERTEENGIGNLRSFSETTRMFDYGFDNFTYKTIIEAKTPLREVPVTLSKLDHVTLQAASDLEVLMPKGLNAEHLDRSISLNKNPVEAPIKEGDILGQLIFSYQEKEYARVDLLAAHDVEADSFMLLSKNLHDFFTKKSVRITIVAVILLVLILVLWRVNVLHRRSRYGRSYSGRRGRRNYRGRRR